MTEYPKTTLTKSGSFVGIDVSFHEAIGFMIEDTGPVLFHNASEESEVGQVHRQIPLSRKNILNIRDALNGILAALPATNFVEIDILQDGDGDYWVAPAGVDLWEDAGLGRDHPSSRRPEDLDWDLGGEHSWPLDKVIAEFGIKRGSISRGVVVQVAGD